MRACSNNSTMIQYKDLITLSDCGNALGNQKYSTVFQCCDGFAQLCIRGIIKRTCRIIQNQNLWIGNNGSCDGKSLFLTTRQIPTTLFDHCIKSILLSLNHFRCLSERQSLPDLFIGCFRISHLHVFTDRTGKQHCLLWNGSKYFTQFFSRIVLNRMTVQ